MFEVFRGTHHDNFGIHEQFRRLWGSDRILSIFTGKFKLGGSNNVSLNQENVDIRTKNSPEHNVNISWFSLPKINKMFDYIEVAIERIMDDEQYFANDLRAVR